MDNTRILMEELNENPVCDADLVPDRLTMRPMGYGGVVADAAAPATKPTYDYDIDAHMADWQSLNRAIHQLGLLLLACALGFAAGLVIGCPLGVAAMSDMEIEQSGTASLIGSGNRWASLDSYKPAPLWMLKYIGALVAIVQHKRPVRVVVAPQNFFDSIPKSDKAAGACMMLPDGEDVIIMPDHAVDTEPWRDILAHEFAHVMHTSLDRVAIPAMDSAVAAAYEEELEALVRVIGGLVAFAELHGRFRATEKGLVYTGDGRMAVIQEMVWENPKE